MLTDDERDLLRAMISRIWSIPYSRVPEFVTGPRSVRTRGREAREASERETLAEPD